MALAARSIIKFTQGSLFYFGYFSLKVVREGCLVKTCVGGQRVESLADECVELIEKQVDKLFEKKLSKKGGKYIYEFDKMEREDKFHNKLEDEFKNWEERYPSFLVQFLQFKFSSSRKFQDLVSFNF